MDYANLSHMLSLTEGAIGLIHAAVKEVEILFPGASKGADKFDAVVSKVEAALPGLGATLEQVAELRPTVASVIEQAVTAMNAPDAPSPAALAAPAPSSDVQAMIDAAVGKALAGRK